jgi:hypothetical protein
MRDQAAHWGRLMAKIHRMKNEFLQGEKMSDS